MTMQTFGLTQGRINKFKGQILAHAVPLEVLGKTGRQVRFPKNNSDTYVARRWLPYGATATSANTQNRFFQDGNGDRGAAVVQVGAGVGAGLQVDVLLADRRAVGDHGEGVGGDGRSAVDVQSRGDAGGGQPQRVHLADGCAAVGDFGAGEDASGDGEVGADGVSGVDDRVGEAGVACADVGHSDGGDGGEGDQLGFGAGGDHGCIPSVMRSARAMSMPLSVPLSVPLPMPLPSPVR